MRETTKIPIWIKSEYVTIVTPPFFRLEGEPSEEGKPPRFGFPKRYYNKSFFSLQYLLFNCGF